MGFFEFAVAFGVTVVLPVTIVKLIIDYRKARMAAERQVPPPENAIRVSELKAMMHEVAQEELASIKDRVEWIEDRLEISESRKLDSPQDRQLLAAKQRESAR